MARDGSASQQLKPRAPAALLGLLTVLAYSAIAGFTLFNAQTFTAEIAALVRGWWYTTGAVTPYSAADTPHEMPLYFYELGYWQQLVGGGHITGRVLSIVLGAISGALLFVICRRLTANTLVALAATFIFLATPSTSFFFATATSAATVSTLFLAAVWLIVDSMGKPRAHVSAAFGLVCALLYFTRQDSILAIIVLIPLYIAAVGRDRALQAVSVVATIVVTAALLAVLLPAKFHVLALNLPVVGPMLGDAGLLGPDYTLLTRGTHGGGGLDAALDPVNLKGFVESFVLPNAGTIILSLALFAVAQGPLRVLWIAPLYFIWLALTQYVTFASAEGCESCMQQATPSFIGIGALAAALTLAMSGRWAKNRGFATSTVVIIGALAAVALNTLAPRFATHPATASFPRQMLDGLHSPPELAEIRALATWVASTLKTKEPVLVIQGLGGREVAALPFAVAATGHAMPGESLELKATRRTINQSLVGEMRQSVRSAVEAAGLWSDEIMHRWIEKDYNVILLQDDPSTAALKKEIETGFDRGLATRYRGASIVLYTRKPAP